MRGHRLFVNALCAGTILNPLNSSMVAVGLVAFREEFGLTVAGVAWVVTAFYVASAAIQPALGALADQYGPRSVFVSGMAVIVVGSLIAASAGSWVMVCVGRVVVAAGTSAAFPSAVAAIGRYAPEPVQSTMLARLQFAGNLGVSVGPVLGGLVLTFSTWRVLFLVSIPLAILAAALVRFVLPPDLTTSSTRSLWATVRGLDLAGVLLLATVLATATTTVQGAGPLPRSVTAALMVVAAALLLRDVRRHPRPVVDLRALRANRVLTVVYPAWLLLCVFYYVALYGLPSVLEDVGGLEPGTVGLVMVPLAVAAAAVAPVAGWTARRWGSARVVVGGALLNVLVCLVATGLTVTRSLAMAAACAACLGLAHSVTAIAANQRIFEHAGAERVGASAGLFQSLRYVGAITGAWVLALVFDEQATARGWLVACLAGGVLCVLATAMVARRR